MKSVLDALIYKSSISNGKSDVVTHFDDFFRSRQINFSKKKFVPKHSQNRTYYYIFLFFNDLIYKNSTPRLIK